MEIFRRLPPVISVPAFYVLISVQALGRILFGSYFGILILSIGTYVAVESYSNYQPFGLKELILWTASLSTDYKVGLLSSLVTVFGFVIAFNTATKNWQDQLNAHLKLQVANEIEHFFGSVASDISDLRIYVNDLIETINKIQGQCTVGEASFNIQYNKEQAKAFFDARKRLSAASVEVYRISGRHYSILSSGAGLLSSYELAAGALKKISEIMWIHVPIVDLNNANHIQDFVNQLKVTECIALTTACEAANTKISGLAGGIRGYLISPIVGFNLSMYFNLVSTRKAFRAAIEEFHAQLNDKNG